MVKAPSLDALRALVPFMPGDMIEFSDRTSLISRGFVKNEIERKLTEGAIMLVLGIHGSRVLVLTAVGVGWIDEVYVGTTVSVLA